MAVKLGDVLKKLPLVFRQNEHYFDVRKARIIKAPTKSGDLIKYALVECSCGCDGVKVAPKENFLSCTEEHIEEIKIMLKRVNLTLMMS
jgi:hypothetical protein